MAELPPLPEPFQPGDKPVGVADARKARRGFDEAAWRAQADEAGPEDAAAHAVHRTETYVGNKAEQAAPDLRVQRPGLWERAVGKYHTSRGARWVAHALLATGALAAIGTAAVRMSGGGSEKRLPPEPVKAAPEKPVAAEAEVTPEVAPEAPPAAPAKQERKKNKQKNRPAKVAAADGLRTLPSTLRDHGYTGDIRQPKLDPLREGVDEPAEPVDHLKALRKIVAEDSNRPQKKSSREEMEENLPPPPPGAMKVLEPPPAGPLPSATNYPPQYPNYPPPPPAPPPPGWWTKRY